MSEKVEKEKVLNFSVEYRYPGEISDDEILDRFAEQIMNDASTVNKDNIRVVDSNAAKMHCPKCGNVLEKKGRDIETYKCLGIMEYGMYCNICDITINIEDRSAFEQEGKVLITFA